MRIFQDSLVYLCDISCNYVHFIIFSWSIQNIFDSFINAEFLKWNLAADNCYPANT